MAVQINQLVRTLLQKDSIEQCSLEELTQYAERFPYFGAAQLLLAKKFQSDKPELYPEQMQKTLLYFNNPLWVQQLLNGTGHAEIFKQQGEITADRSGPAVEMTKENEPSMIPEEKHTQEQGVSKTIQSAPSHDILFEPYHTVDYFASQGIQFKAEEKPADRFGQQLKSFTEWLKILRSKPAAAIRETVIAADEHNVLKLAERSLDEKEVITEAMADVWIKQGNPQKAIAIYTELSLTEPSKSAYFAAKIEALKKTN